MLGIVGLTELTLKKFEKAKDRTHTVAAKESSGASSRDVSPNTPKGEDV